MNSAVANGAVALSPVLPDVIGNYVISTTINDTNSTALVWATGFIVSTASLRVTATRQLVIPSVALASTGVAVAGNDLASVSQPASPATHGSDILDGALGHGHNTQAHPVTDPQHTHAQAAGTGAALTVNVDWVIMHV